MNITEMRNRAVIRLKTPEPMGIGDKNSGVTSVSHKWHFQLLGGKY